MSLFRPKHAPFPETCTFLVADDSSDDPTAPTPAEPPHLPLSRCKGVLLLPRRRLRRAPKRRGPRMNTILPCRWGAPDSIRICIGAKGLVSTFPTPLPHSVEVSCTQLYRPFISPRSSQPLCINTEHAKAATRILFFSRFCLRSSMCSGTFCI